VRAGAARAACAALRASPAECLPQTALTRPAAPADRWHPGPASACRAATAGGEGCELWAAE